MAKIIKLDKQASIHFLLVRADRLGDLALSMQCAKALKLTYKNARVSFLVSSYTQELLQNNPFIDSIFAIDKIEKLHKFLASLKIDVSISLYSDKASTIALFRAGIRARIGNFSKIYSFLFNYKIKQQRSKSIKNEALYNLDLLRVLDCKNLVYPKVYLKLNEILKARSYIDAKLPLAKKLVLIHPGSRGSSIDFSIQKLLEIADSLHPFCNVLITGSKEEMNIYLRLYQKGGFKNLSSSNFLDAPFSLREFLSLISCSFLFISNATGPLHCARSLDVATLSFYPLLKAISPIRWGAFCKKPSRHIIFTPLGIYNDEIKSKLVNNQIPDELARNMQLISKEEVFLTIKNLLEDKSIHKEQDKKEGKDLAKSFDIVV